MFGWDGVESREMMGWGRRGISFGKVGVDRVRMRMFIGTFNLVRWGDED